jgi:hypothetical protein
MDGWNLYNNRKQIKVWLKRKIIHGESITTAEEENYKLTSVLLLAKDDGNERLCVEQ